MANILVYVQIQDGEPHEISLQCMAKARQMADTSGGKVDALAIGAGITDAAQGLFSYGADNVFVADDPRLEHYLTTPYKKVMKEFLSQDLRPVILLPATTSGDDLAPIMAAEMNAACVLDVDGMHMNGDRVALKRLEFDRKVYTEYSAGGAGTLIVTAKDGIAESPEQDPARSGQVTAIDVPLTSDDLKSKVLKRDVVAKTVNLKDAETIVTAGAGVGNETNFARIRELAEALNAEIGATRAVVDAGWLPADHQIGQTGATVRPNLYIACGISGAVQHWVGMMDAKTIVAINIDKSAPIMKRAHYRIVGDLNEVIPKLIKLMQ